YHHDVFFDWMRCDRTRIRQLLQQELLESRVRLPYRYGRLLYDRFNDSFSATRTDHLLSQDVQNLLRDTPTGVFQLGMLLSGPLGVLDSCERRYIPPGLSLPLWHCSDTGCNAIHHVQLIPPNIPVVDIFAVIANVLSDRLGPPSEWYVLGSLSRGPRPRPARPYIDLPLLVGDCVVGRERVVLLE